MLQQPKHDKQLKNQLREQKNLKGKKKKKG